MGFLQKNIALTLQNLDQTAFIYVLYLNNNMYSIK